MRFGKWRGMPLAAALAAVLGIGLTTAVHADGWLFHDTLPGEVPAYNFATGGEYLAPPVPYGHYAKDYAGEVHKAGGLLKGLLHGGGLCHGCGLGHGCRGQGDSGCGFCAGKGLFHHGKGNDDCGSAIDLVGPCDPGLGSGHHHKKNFAPCHASTVVASSQIQPVAQAAVMPSGQALCIDPGCKVKGHHGHLGNLMNKLHCRHCGSVGTGDPCSDCGGSGHGCGLCGGKGCANCLKGLASKAHGLLSSLLHHQKVEYFVGAGGPVPLTPGYVPYIVSTRSPRDYFAFPPMNPNDP
jgi:hypothetical protein